jgi:hypothetical protein
VDAYHHFDAEAPPAAALDPATRARRERPMTETGRRGAILSDIHKGGGRMSGSNGREIYRVVWPRGVRTVQAADVAPRLTTLEGKTIGQLWDDLFRGDEIFPILEEELGRRFPGIRFVGYDTFGSTHGRDEGRVLAELPDKLRRHEVDAVISGMAC